MRRRRGGFFIVLLLFARISYTVSNENQTASAVIFEGGALADPDWERLFQQLRSTEPFYVSVVIGEADEQDIRDLLDAMNRYNIAAGGRGLEFIELDKSVLTEGIVHHKLAACPAVPDDEI